MSFSGAMTVIGTHLTAAGAAVTPAIANVRRGAPMRIAEPLIRFWYTGDSDSELIPATLTDATFAERIAVGAYWPIADGSENVAQQVDIQTQALKAEIRHRLLADGDLGGNVAECEVGDFTVEYLELFTGGWAAVLLTTLDLHLTDTDTFAD